MIYYFRIYSLTVLSLDLKECSTDMYTKIQTFINEDTDYHFTKLYETYRNILFNLLDTPIQSTHHIGGTKHFNYPTEPILDILVGVESLHDITSLDEKRLNYAGFYRLHHTYKKKVVMAQFNNMIDLKQIARLHIIQKYSLLYNEYLQTNSALSTDNHIAKVYGENKAQLAHNVPTIRAYDNQKQKLFSKLAKDLKRDEVTFK